MAADTGNHFIAGCLLDRCDGDGHLFVGVGNVTRNQEYDGLVILLNTKIDRLLIAVLVRIDKFDVVALLQLLIIRTHYDRGCLLVFADSHCRAGTDLDRGLCLILLILDDQILISDRFNFRSRNVCRLTCIAVPCIRSGSCACTVICIRISVAVHRSGSHGLDLLVFHRKDDRFIIDRDRVRMGRGSFCSFRNSDCGIGILDHRGSVHMNHCHGHTAGNTDIGCARTGDRLCSDQMLAVQVFRCKLDIQIAGQFIQCLVRQGQVKILHSLLELVHEGISHITGGYKLHQGVHVNQSIGKGISDILTEVNDDCLGIVQDLVSEGALTAAREIPHIDRLHPGPCAKLSIERFDRLVHGLLFQGLGGVKQSRLQVLLDHRVVKVLPAQATLNILKQRI